VQGFFWRRPTPHSWPPKATRNSGRWRPFAAERKSADSQKYAVRALRAAFTWLVDVRYLAGNPWKSRERSGRRCDRVDALKVDRALPADLRIRILSFVDSQCERAGASYWHAVRVVLLLGGDSGRRHEEFTRTFRENLSTVSPNGRRRSCRSLKGRNTKTVIPFPNSSIRWLNGR